jgi:agmatine/peptidylarginine deiminase
MSFEKIRNIFKHKIGPEQITEDKANQSKNIDLSRRKFIKTAAILGLSAAASSVIPKVVEAGLSVTTRKETTGIEEKNDININDQVIVKSEKTDNQVEILPEYKRNLEKLLLTIPSKENDEYVKSAYSELLRSLPEYTEIDIIANENKIESIKNLVKNIKAKNKINYLAIDRESDFVEEWAQDFGEAATVNGQKKLLVSAMVSENNPRLDKIDRFRMEKRTQAAIKALGEENVEVAKFIFEGGNMSFDRTANGLRVFIGHNDVEFNIQNDRSEKSDIKAVAEIISRNLGGAEVVVMGNHSQEGTFVHIDQSFIILEGKIAIINQFDKFSDPMVRYQHQYYKAQLEKLGYKTIVIENDIDDLENCRSSLNAIPYIDRRTKEKKVIFPVFENEVKNDFKKPISKLDKTNLQGKALAAFNAFLQAGYKPMPIRDLVTHAKNGNIHCISNVLAKIRDKKEIPA